MTVLLRARSLGKDLGGRRILDAVDLAVNEREIVTVIGPNGAGKSTLLRILLGLMAPDRGEAWVRPGTRIGYMPQRLAIDANLPMTVRRFLRLSGTHGDTALRMALDEVGAPQVLDVAVQSISGGELQRVLLARALLRQPALLVLDEPVQGVDVAGQEDLFRLIVDIRSRRGCGVLMVSHDLHLVMAATDTVVCLNHHVCCTGRPEAVRVDPAYLALFGAARGGALAVYTHRHDHVHDAPHHDASAPEPHDPHPHDHAGHNHA
ncbi:MAG TPA: ATP-binding cassette domain-containing protein [Stellaceae bacterium]